MIAILTAADCPILHFVPAETSSTADQIPLAHRWNDVPSIQFHIPSAMQVAPGIMGTPEPPGMVAVDAGLLGLAGGTDVTEAETVVNIAEDLAGEGLLRSPIVSGLQPLGPDDQPVSRLAIFEA